MRQRLLFDDEGMQKVHTLTPFNPEVERALSEIAAEEELARSTPEDRQRHWARVASEERRRAVESRSARR